MLDRAEPSGTGQAIESRELTAVKDAAPAEAGITAPSPRGAIRGADPLWAAVLLWGCIAVYIGAMSIWAYGAGSQIRYDAWDNSRTIRFHGDISNGIRWGTQVLRRAENIANSPPPARGGKAKPAAKADRVIAKAAPDPNDKHQRPLTIAEMLHGADQLYQDLVVGQPPDGDYQLDYPPLRLMAMTLWTREVESHVPNFRGWPGRYHPGGRPLYSATGDPSALVDENIADPMLAANSYCIVVTAIAMFFLVWIWVNRGGRPTSSAKWTGWKAWVMPRRRLVPWKPTPIGKLNGLLVFAVSAPAFFCAVVIAENPAPAPPPSVEFTSRPALAKSSSGTISATITASIDGQGSDAQWHIDWGLTPNYGNQTRTESAGDEDVAAIIGNLPPNETIHYRITASNSIGVTRTDDFSFNTSNALTPWPSKEVYGAVWLSWTQWVGIIVLFTVMASSLWFMPPIHRGWACGLVAALLLWFDPSVIVDSHVWPQWDVWMLPPFFLAALAATLDWWFVAGVIIGVGVMFKGQTLMLAPVLAIWPLFAGRFAALARLTTGFILAAGVILSPWLVFDNVPVEWSSGPMRWIGGVMAAAVIAAAISFYRRPLLESAAIIWDELKNEWHGATDKAGTGVTASVSFGALVVFCVCLLGSIITVTLLILRRWPVDSELPRVAGLFLLLGVLVPPWFLKRAALGVWVAAVLAASIWMSAYLYHGDWSWKTVGFEYGTRKFDRMALGTGALGNVPQILESRFGWDIHDTAMTFHPPDLADALHLGKRGPNGQFTGWVHDWGLDGSAVQLDIRQFMMLVFVIMVVLGGFGAALQSRRNDPRFLACLASVWALMPSILCQMAQRYLMFGAAASCMLIAISPGLTVLHVIMSLIAAGVIGGQLLGSWDRSRSPRIEDFMTRFGPDDGWIMLVIGLVILYIALAPGRRPSRGELLPP
ncbi:MAG: hypothetical protein ABSH22_09560 [Tepidisphaeraceae bacterium]|jgi:hypothetical protein